MRTRIFRKEKRLAYTCCAILLLLLLSVGSSAQICQGSLGDPIIDITFGAGPNPGPPLSAATTNYTYVSNDCPKDGYYAVRNKTEYCHDTMWFNVTDHTGDPNGYFMLVNASFQPGNFYLDTVRNLCAGSTYEFAAWLINVSKPKLCWGATQIIVPNITFRIEKTDGSLVQEYNTGDIPASDPPQWKQYGFFFTTPSGVNEVVLRMVNNAPGGCGNDVGLDDITFRPCGPQLNATISGVARNSDTLCGGTSKTYTFVAQTSGGYTNPVYQWQQSTDGNTWVDMPGQTSTSTTVTFPATTAAGKYYYRLLAAESGNMGSPNCRVASRPVIITVTEVRQVTASSNSPVCTGGNITLQASAQDPVRWEGPNGFSADGAAVTIANAKSSNAGDYLAVVQTGGCNWSDTATVVVSPGPAVTATPASVGICEGDSVAVSASGASSYQWLPPTGVDHPDAAQVIIRPQNSTTYSVIGSDGSSCKDTAFVSIRVHRRPVANAGPDVAAMQGTPVQLNATATGDSLDYYWTPAYAIDNQNVLQPVVNPSTDTSYVLHVTSLAGCGVDEDTVKVTFFRELKIPNAFSPNGDGVNDRWNIAGLSSYPTGELTLFDRYGREVLRAKNFQPWDGTRNGIPLPTGVYYYVIDLRNGSPKFTGSVYIAR
ncbi:MAG TPA: gliding motility-associated C-terminal domain-containing protein [Chitinophagaceae bacterium]